LGAEGEESEAPEQIAASDSVDKPTYKTKSGRIVYGGGGITPDIKVDPDLDLTRTTIKLIQHPSRIFFEYASDYAATHQDLADDFSSFARNFELQDEQVQDLKSLIEQKEIEIDQDEFKDDLNYIKNYVKAEIASSLWGKDEFYAVRLSTDNQVQEALKYFPKAKELAMAQ
jgi:carboxyl-terminal processing protease